MVPLSMSLFTETSEFLSKYAVFLSKSAVKYGPLNGTFRPEIIDMTKLADMTNRERLQNAFTQAEKKFGIEQLIDPEDVDVDKPDERSIITYVSSLYDVFPKVSHYVIHVLSVTLYFLRNTIYVILVTSFI